jgi:hypothetical protein
MLPEEEEIIRRWSQGLTHDAPLDLILTDDARTAKLVDFCDRMAKLAPRVRIRKQQSDTADLPAIGILSNLRYHGVPEANELVPFLKAVAMAAEAETAGTPSAAEFGLEGIDLPAGLDLFIATGCTHCPAMVRRLAPLAVASDRIRLSIIDAMFFRESAAAENIRAVPTLLLDGKFRFNGVVPLTEVTQMLSRRDPADLPKAILVSSIEDGNAAKVAELMIAHGIVFPALIDLLTDERWSRRLGAMVALETAAEIDPVLAAEAAPLLLDRIATASDTVKGDVLYILGEIGGADLVPFLETIAEGSASTEVLESAEEAMNKIHRKQQRI